MEKGTEHPHKRIAVGEAVGDITLQDANGNQLELSKLSGEQGVVVGFMHGTYCAFCMQQLNRSNLVADKLHDVGVNLIWVLDDQSTTVAAYQLAASPPPRFALMPESSPPVHSKFGVDAADHEPAPKIYYIDKQQVVRYLEQTDNPHAPPAFDLIIALAKSHTEEAA